MQPLVAGMAGGTPIYQVSQLVVWFFLYAFAGWLFEVGIALVQHRRFVNRGFFFGPICPIYGVGALMAIVFVGHIPNPVVAFFAGGLSAGAMEFATSWVLERIFHARWWDYSDWRFNLQGRVCLASVTTFGVLMLAVSHLIHPPIARLTATLPPAVLMGVAGALLTLFALDFARSALHMRALNVRLAQLQERITVLASDASTRMAEMVDETSRRAADALEWAGEASTRARTRVEQARQGAAEAWADVRAAKSASELAESLRELAPQLGRYRAAGRELDDPDFLPTSAREAWELIKSLVRGRGGKR